MFSEGRRQPDWVGRGIGLAVFAGGIVLLILVFVWINQTPALLKQPTEDWPQYAMRAGVRIVQLFVSGLVASWIAGRGAQLYGAANRALSDE